MTPCVRVPAAADWNRRAGPQAGQSGVAGPATYQGRPAWVLETPVERNRLSTYSADHMGVTVDQATSFPVRVVETFKGDLVREIRLEDLELDPALADNTFTVVFPPGMEVTPLDQGFHRVSVPIDSRSQMPHLWVMDDTLVVTVAGDLTRAELIAVAESLTASGAQ